MSDLLILNSTLTLKTQLEDLNLDFTKQYTKCAGSNPLACGAIENTLFIEISRENETFLFLI